MTYRYTEEEIALIRKRQNASLAEFQRNSGRGLPDKTVKEMERGQGVKLNADGEPVPVKNRTTPKRKPATLTAPKVDVAAKIELSEGSLEAQVARHLEKGKKVLTKDTQAPGGRPKRGKPLKVALRVDKVERKPAKAPKRLPIPREEDECIWLYQWAQLQRWQGLPIADVLIHIPNGAFLGHDAKTRAITMGKLKAMGVRPGCYDYLIPVSCGGYHGLWLEMKRTDGGSGLSLEQKDFRRLMVKLAWRCETAHGWVQASRIIEEYLSQVILAKPLT